MSGSFFLILGFFVAGLASADQLASRAACASLLSHSRVIQGIVLQNLEGENNWSEAYLNLLNLVLEGIDEIDNHAFGHANSMQVKTQLLNYLASIERPASPLDHLQTKFSPKISTLADSGQLDVITENLSDEEWRRIRQIIQTKLTRLVQIQTAQNIAQPETQEDFSDQPNHRGENRLHRFIRDGQLEKAQQLVNSSYINTRYINHANLAGKTPLDILYDLASVKPFLDTSSLATALALKNARTNEELITLREELALAARTNDVDKIRLIYELGFKMFDATDSHNHNPPLQAAIKQGHIEAVKLLINLGVNINYKSMSGPTPIVQAMLSNRPLILEILLAAQADVNAFSGPWGTQFSPPTTPLLWALTLGQPKSMELLIKHGAKFDYVDGNNKNIWHWFAMSKFSAETLAPITGILKTLPLHGLIDATADEPILWRLTPLEFAMKYGQFENLKILLELGANPLAETGSQTPYEYARNSVSSRKNRAGYLAEMRKYLPRQKSKLEKFVSDKWNKIRAKLSQRDKP